ncbi:MAG TPA: hypothetical protein VJ916_00295 [Anaerovoracaceae bacterium]|nr:hypothetical protein [Anaerovoracaceae bacterium]
MLKRLLPILILTLILTMTSCNNETEEPVEEPAAEPIEEPEPDPEPESIFEVTDRLVINETIDGVTVFVRQPIVTEDTINHEELNSALSTMDYHEDKIDIEDLIIEYNSNNQGNPMVSYTMDYEVVTDNLNISVIAIKSDIRFTASGDLLYYDCYYYDNDTNKVISSEACLEKHGMSWNEAIAIVMEKDEVFAELYDEMYPEKSPISNIYFLFDENGELITYYQLWL